MFAYLLLLAAVVTRVVPHAGWMNFHRGWRRAALLWRTALMARDADSAGRSDGH